MSTTKLTKWTLAGLLAVSAVTAQAQAFKSQYMVIDLSGGPSAKKYPVSYETKPPDLDFDTCRTKELWLRLVPAGTFMMGSPDDELGRSDNETQRRVTLTQPFYIGVFQVTQAQYELITGTTPSQYKGSTRPVERVSYDMLRGTRKGSQWPTNNDVDDTSFFGVLRAKTGLLADLPTEAQWEYACRAGTVTALNSGNNLTGREQCPNMAEIGRYIRNWNDGKGKYSERHTSVGMYKPNVWGLYDMHGNVWEWCLDKWANHGATAVTDPKGSVTGDGRVWRGGCANLDGDVAHACRSASRVGWWLNSNDMGESVGFRMVVLPNQGQAATPRQPALPSEPTPIAESPKEAKTPKAAFDAKKTEALFAGTDWNFTCGWNNFDCTVTFARDGRVKYKSGKDWQHAFAEGKWEPSGPQSVTVGNTVCEITPDRKRIYVTDPDEKRCAVVYRGTKMPTLDAKIIKMLCKPNTVWATQINGRRVTFAFDAEFIVASNLNEGKTDLRGKWNGFGEGHFIELGLIDYWGVWVLAQDAEGGWVFKNYHHEFRPEPAQPGDPLPSRKANARAKPDQPVQTVPEKAPGEAAQPKEAVILGDTEEELAETCAEFKAVWDVYKTNAEKINAEFQPKFDALQQQYGKALETLKGTAQRRGDLDKAKAVIAEMARFEETKSLPPEPDKDAIAEIKTLQANAIRPFTPLEKDRLARMTTLTRRYGQALEQLQTDLVKAGKFDEATAVRTMRERAKRAE